jgi:hypothetical protein
MNKTHVSLLSSKYAVTGSLFINNMSDSLLMQDTIVVLGDCQIESGPVLDKTIVVSGMLTLRKNAVVQLSQLFAERIEIESGTTESSIFYSTKKMHLKGGNHNSQFFSQDTLYCDKCINFNSLSIFACLQNTKNDSTVSGNIIFEAGTKVKGIVISCRDSSAKRIITGPSIVFGKGCTLTGAAITDYDIDLLDIQIKGHIWARSITTSDSGKSYTNFLIRSTIQKPDELSFFPLIGELPARVKVHSLNMRL